MDRDAVGEYVEQSDAVLDSSPQMDEANTKAAILTVVAISTLKKGKRKTGLLALIGAVGFGFNTTACFCGLNKTLGINTTSDE